MEKTFIILKPDAIQRGLVGEIIKRIEHKGLKIVATKLITSTEEQIFEHYNKDNTWFLEKGNRIVEERQKANMPIEKEAIEYGKDIIRALAKYMNSTPIMPIIIEGNQAVKTILKLVGGTEPLTADIGTIRGDFITDSYDLATKENRAVRNLIHASESPEEAEREINIWFNTDEIMKYNTINERMIYDINLDGIIE